MSHTHITSLVAQKPHVAGTKEAQHIVRGIESLQKKHGRMKREYEVPPPLDQNVIDSIKTLSSMKIREILR